MDIEKCPICGKSTLGEVKPNDNCTFGITQVAKSGEKIDSFMPVRLIGCASCKTIFHVCEQLEHK